MTAKNADTANDTALPKIITHKPESVLTATDWAEIRDGLVLALDALGEGPEDVDHALLVNSILNQRVALRIAHYSLEKMKGAVQ